MERHSLTGKREWANYSVLCYIQRIQLFDCETGDVEGLLIEREEVRVADACVQTLLKIQALTSRIQQVSEGQYQPIHPSRKKAGVPI